MIVKVKKRRTQRKTPINVLKLWLYTYREILIGIVWIITTLILWAIKSVTNLTSLDNLIISIAWTMFNVVFVFMSILFKKLSEVLPSKNINLHNTLINQTDERLNSLTFQCIEDRQSLDFTQSKLMVEQGKYFIDKGEWYLETLRLCRAIQTVGGEIMAVSAYNIEDFIEDENAKKYLTENATALRKGIRVRRVFIIDEEDLNRSDILYILQEHNKKLSLPNNIKCSTKDFGVKWILKRHAGKNGGQDFALFFPYVVVRQRPGGQQLEVSQIQMDVEDAASALERLWKDSNSKRIDKLPEIKRGKPA